jgi:hyperosmotically inducible protein
MAIERGWYPNKHHGGGGISMVQKNVHVVVAFLLTALLALTVSCSTPAGRSAGDVVDDATITTQVKAEILADKLVNGVAISVQTFKGEVVLTGAVDTQAQINKAESIARSVKGVTRVKNLLKLK